MRSLFLYLILFLFININFSYSKEKYSNNDNLLEAVKSNDISKVLDCIRNGNDLNIKDASGNTPLYYAIKNNNFNITRLLFRNGANPNIKNKNRLSNYCGASLSQDYRIQRMFENYDYSKCKVNKKNQKENKKTSLTNKKINWQHVGIASVGIGGIGALIASSSGGGDNDNSSNDTQYDYVGQVDSTILSNILSGTNTDDADFYSGYTFSKLFSNGNTYSNFDDYNEIRLAYAWARGYTGEVSNSSYISSSSGTPYYYSDVSGTSSYNIGDSVKVAVVDTGVFSDNELIKNNLTFSTSPIDSNQIYQYYKNNCIFSFCQVTAHNNDDSSVTLTKYLKCSQDTSSQITCSFYNNQSGDIITNSSFILTSDDTTPATTESYHGTMVSSIIAANSNGENIVSGVAPNATVIPYSIAAIYNYSDNYTIQSFASNEYIGQAFESAAESGAVAINNSWGSDCSGTITNETTLTSYFGESFLNSIKTTVNDYDAIFVWSAGNYYKSQPDSNNLIPLYLTNDDGSLVFYDSDTNYYKNFITVVGYDTENNTLADWSNICGVAKNYCLTAPGESLLVGYDNSNSIASFSGTSFSAPIVTGAIAILKGAYPYLTGSDITRLLFVTARDLGDEGIDEIYGWGMLDLERATRPVGATIVPIDSTIASDSTSSHNLSSSNLKLNSMFGNTIKSANLSFVYLDSFNRTFQANLNDYIYSETNRIDTIDVLNNFATNNINSIYLSKDKSFNLYSNIDYSNNEFKELEFSYSGDVFSNDSFYDGFNFYYGSNPYNAFIKNKNDFYSNYSLSNSYGYNLLNPYFTTNSNENLSFNNTLNLNDKTKLNIGVLYQNYNMTYYTDTDKKNEETEELGSAFSALSSIEYNPFKNLNTKMEIGFINEYNTLFGSRLNGAFGIGNNNITYLSSLETNLNLFKNKISLFGKSSLGYTVVNSNPNNSLIKNISNLYSNSFSFGFNFNLRSDKKDSKRNISLLLSQPVRIVSGSMDLSLPVARDYDGNLYYSNYKLPLREEKELNLQLAYNHYLDNDTAFNFGLMAKNSQRNEYVFLIKYKRSFELF